MTFLKTLTCTDFQRGVTEKKFNGVFNVRSPDKVMSTIANLIKKFTTPQAQEKKIFKTFVYIHGSRPHLWLKFRLLLKSVGLCLPIYIISVEYFLYFWIRENQSLSRKTLKKVEKTNFFQFIINSGQASSVTYVFHFKIRLPNSLQF